MIKLTASIGLGVVIATLCMFPAGAAVLNYRGAAATTWVPTSTVAFPSVKGLVDLGKVSDATPLRITLSLPIRNRSSVDRLIRAQATPGSSMFHRYLTPAQADAMFDPRGPQVQAVGAYLNAQGFKKLSVTKDNLLLTAYGTTGLASRAFDTQIHALRWGGKEFLGNVRPARVPATLAGDVLAVEGLQTLPARTALQYRAGARRGAAPSSIPTPYGSCTALPYPVLGSCVFADFLPQDFQSAYNATKATTGSLTTIAIFAEGDLTQVMKDLRQFETQQKLPQVPAKVIITSLRSTDTSGADEFDLDTQYSTGLAQTVKALDIYDAFTLTDQDTGLGFDRFKTDDTAQAGSASFGECEVFPATDGALVTDDEIFGVAALQGQSIFSSAGDNGTTCPVVAATGAPGTGLPAQSYPASSEYVVSVGGTTLLTNPDNTYDGEIAWLGTGGGISVEEPSPYWQSGIVPPVNNAPPPVPGVTTFKAVPDIAMDADPDTGANVDVGGTYEEIGGTSLASPLALGAWARMQSSYMAKTHRKGRFAPVTLYEEYSKMVTSADLVPPVPPTLNRLIGGFNDVIYGENGLPAKTEYDYTTGLGSLNVGVQIPDSFPI